MDNAAPPIDLVNDSAVSSDLHNSVLLANRGDSGSRYAIGAICVTSFEIELGASGDFAQLDGLMPVPRTSPAASLRGRIHIVADPRAGGRRYATENCVELPRRLDAIGGAPFHGCTYDIGDGLGHVGCYADESWAGPC
jgi:hypothetical protein